MTARRAAIGGVVGPVVFIATWAICGRLTTGYSPVNDAISDLAAVGASTRVAMTTAFIVFGIAMCFYAWAARATLRGWSWLAAAISGIATLGVAAFPLESSSTLDALHGVSAGIGYLTLALTALLAAPFVPLRWLAVACGVTCGVALALTLPGPAHGLFQRIGLTAGDVWIVVSAAAIFRGHCTD
jgi:hypothetical membrane protein